MKAKQGAKLALAATVIGIISGAFAIFSDVAGVGSLLFKKYPFEELEGEFSGKAEGFEFRMCIEQEGDSHFIGSIFFLSNPDTSKVYLEGERDGKTVKLRYKRMAGHPRGPDSGKVVIRLSESKKQFDGYWVSDEKPDHREKWVITKISENCSLIGWKGGLEAP